MDGSIQIDRYVLDTLMRDLVGHDRRTASYLIYLFIFGAGSSRPIALSHQQIADGTGLSKRTVQNATAQLAKRGLLAIERRGQTEAAGLRVLMPWRE